jgi:hypothetical protein
VKARLREYEKLFTIEPLRACFEITPEEEKFNRRGHRPQKTSLLEASDPESDALSDEYTTLSGSGCETACFPAAMPQAIEFSPFGAISRF